MLRNCKKLCIATVTIAMLMMLHLVLHDWQQEANVRKFLLNQHDVTYVRKLWVEYDKGITTGKDKPLLVLFTTMHVSKENVNIHKNLIWMWSLLRPAVKPVLVVTELNKYWINKAKENGWEILYTEHTFGGLPIIRHMWMEVIKAYDAHFYGYANADILFDESLILTLQMLQSTVTRKDSLIIGRRTNYQVDASKLFFELGDIREAAESEAAELFTKHAEDYFITTKEGFPWKRIPDFVIARVGYDNWLVTYALRNYHYVIDATNTILALHQTGSDGNYAGFSHRFLGDVNRLLAGNDYIYLLGKTDCAKLETFYNQSASHLGQNSTSAIVSVRQRWPNPCAFLYHKFNVDLNKL